MNSSGSAIAHRVTEFLGTRARAMTARISARAPRRSEAMGPEAQRNNVGMASRRANTGRHGISGVTSALLQDRHSRVTVTLKYDMEIHRSQYLPTQRGVGPPVPRIAILFTPVGRGLRLVDEPMTTSACARDTATAPAQEVQGRSRAICLRPTTGVRQKVRCASAAPRPQRGQ